MSFVPIMFNPKIRENLSNVNKKIFESIWIECILTTKKTMKQKQFITISYNPRKSLYHLFLEQPSSSIDFAVTGDKPITVMGDYNNDYMNTRERQDLETVVLPYGFMINNTNQPTRVRGISKSVNDYIITQSFRS